MGYSDRAESVLFSQELDSSNSAQRYLIADMYFKKGDYQKAHDLLKKDESESAIIKRINWFEETLEWDTELEVSKDPPESVGSHINIFPSVKRCP